MTIYDQIGGRDAVAAAVDIFYDKVLSDDVLAPYFDGTDMDRQKAHMRAFLAAAIDGPAVYQGRDMAAAHRGLGVTDVAFDHVVEHLVATLTELSVSQDAMGAIAARILPLRDVVVERRALAA